MTDGTPVNRQWVVITHHGDFVIDWGDGMFQDIATGDFVTLREGEISHHPSDKELDWLVHINRVKSFDAATVYFYNLPERPQKMID